MIPRGHHDHDLFINFQGMIESVKNRHSIPWLPVISGNMSTVQEENKSTENYKRAILNVVELVCIMIPFSRMNLIKVILVLRRDT
jgi:hypothetical protein